MDKTVKFITIDTEDIQRRIQEVPIPAGNYASLRGNAKALNFTQRERV